MNKPKDQSFKIKKSSKTNRKMSKLSKMIIFMNNNTQLSNKI